MMSEKIMDKRICFVCDSFISDSDATITGPMVQTYLLGKELMKRGWDVHYLAYSKQDKAGTEENFEGLTIHWIQHRKYLPLLSYFQVLRNLKKINADYYYQRGRDILAGITVRYCRRYRQKFIWASAGESGVERGKYINQLKKKKRSLLKIIPLWIEAKMNDWICEYGIENADRIIVQTVYQGEQLKKNFGMDSIVIKSGHPVPNAIERTKPFKILWIGSIKQVKRPELFLQLAEMCQDLDCEFWMAGQMVDQRFSPMIKSAVSMLPKFKFVGVVPFDQSQTLISQAHVLINTTDDGYEGLPNAFVQAWLSGTVIVSRFSNPDQGITQYDTGYLQPEIKEIAAWLRDIISNEYLWTDLSLNGIKYSKKRYALEEIVNQFNSLIVDNIEHDYV